MSQCRRLSPYAHCRLIRTNMVTNFQPAAPKKEATAMGSLLIHEFDLFNELLPLLLEFL